MTHQYHTCKDFRYDRCLPTVKQKPSNVAEAQEGPKPGAPDRREATSTPDRRRRPIGSDRQLERCRLSSEV